MLISNLLPFNTTLSRIQEIPETFFRNIENADTFDNSLFPVWLLNNRGEEIIFGPRTDLRSKFRALYDKYKGINDISERQKILNAFFNTNRIIDLCNNQQGLDTIELSELHPTIRKEIDDVFLYLYNLALNHQPFIDFVEDNLDKAIRRFTYDNEIEICPFCGLETMIQITGQARIALDHWLNKDRFPFAAVNFNNLIPIGSRCNDSGVKGVKNVLKDKTQQNRVKSFYPFSIHHGIVVKFTFINEPSIDGVKDEDWRLDIFPYDNSETDIFESWDYIFNISIRYYNYFKEYPLLRWEKNYNDFIKKNFIGISHAENIEEFKRNLIYWKSTFSISKQQGSIIYQAFIDYLLYEASDNYLYGLCENFKR